MPDREKTIIKLANWINMPFALDAQIEPSLVSDAFALLKEQEQLIKNHDESLEKARAEIKWLRKMMMGQEKVIRCIDCNRRGTYDCPVYTGRLSDGYDEPDDWYCASGERK